MKFKHIEWTIGWVVLAVLVAACSPNASAEQPDTDQIVKTAVAATLTADNPAPTLAPKLIIAESDVDGNDGNDFVRGSSDSNQGRVVLLPGLNQSDVTDPVTFDEFIAFQIEIFDTRAGLSDGKGIDGVSFQIVADNGDGPVIYENDLHAPPYCALGGSPDCTLWSFADHGNQWPNGTPVLNGLYLARIDIVPSNGTPTQWRWRFILDVPGQPDYAATTNTARIQAIRIQNWRYVVDFETDGFVPTLPGHHLHFFFDTVSPQEAGMPGQGPWQLHPASPGKLGDSPFTHYAVADRPAGAAQLCVLVANPDHTVIQGSGNCLDLP